MNDLLLSMRLLWRDWRAGELQLLVASLVVAVAAVTSVAWLAERVGGATGGRAAEFLAADRVIETDDPLPASWRRQAEALGLETAFTAEFPSVVVAGEQTVLVGVKAASEEYPLRGALRIRDDADGEERLVRQAPPAGTVWVSPRLMVLLDLSLGDSLELGASRFRIDALLTLEPDSGGFFTGLAPRVLMNAADLEATGLIQPASRVDYRLLLAGPDAALDRFVDWLQGREPSWDLETPEQAQPGLASVIDRAQRFLGLAALLTVVVAGVAMLLTVRRYAERQRDRVALMRCMGATAAQVLRLFLLKLLGVAVVGSVLGVILGFGVHVLMIAALADLLPALPPPTWRPIATGVGTGLAALVGFALPTVLRLRRVPPMRVLRRELGAGLLAGRSPYVVALLVIFALMWLQAEELLLATYVAGAVAGTLGLLAVAAAALLLGLRRLRRRRLWLSGLQRQPGTAVLQIVSVGLGLMALLLLTVVRQDLLSTWLDRIPPDAPNVFLINVQPEEVPDLRGFLRETEAETQLHPMIRGRLVAVGGEPVEPEEYDNPEARRMAAREFNLSAMETLPDDNRIVAGDWWGTDPERPGQWSVEREIAQSLGIELGDELRFRIAGREVAGTVTSLREVQWDSFNANFFVVGPPELLRGYPATYITSFYLPSGRDALMAELVRRFPSVTVIDVSSILRTVRDLTEQGAKVVQLMASLTLVAGLLVLLAALRSSGEERRFEGALLRAFGAERRLVRRLARWEFWLLGGIAGGLAGVAAAVAGYVIGSRFFQLDYGFDPFLPILGAVAGALLVWLAGALATRRYYRSSPMRLLRQAD